MLFQVSCHVRILQRACQKDFDTNKRCPASVSKYASLVWGCSICDRDGFPSFAWITPPSPLPEPALTSVLKPKSCAELSFGRMPSFQLTPAGPPCSSKTRIFTLLKSFRHADRPARPARASQPHVQTDAARIRQRSDSQRHLAPLCVALCDR